MGGAEKRFIETLKRFCTGDMLEITILESAPSLLAKTEIVCKRFILPSRIVGERWLSTYFGWIIWIVKASAKSLTIAHNSRPEAVFVPNNTVPNLVSGVITSSVLRLPLYVTVHHVDIPPPDSAEKNCSLHECYQSIGYGRLVSLAKTLTFYVTLSLLKKAKRIVTVSNFTAQALRNNGVSNVRILVSGNAVDVNFIRNVRAYSEEKIFDGVFVGRISKEKGVFDLLTVWKEVVKVRKNAKLLIIGNGLESKSVKEKIAALHLDNNIDIRRQCNDNELYSLLKASRVFLFPSLFEGWGIAVAEALACGLPVVAYDIPALREVFGKCQSVFLVPARNRESMTSVFLDVLRGGKTELEKLGNDGTTYVERFSWETISRLDMKFLGYF
jgi:glycosyltransferase involved in cell wall biosynthesis